MTPTGCSALDETTREKISISCEKDNIKHTWATSCTREETISILCTKDNVWHTCSTDRFRRVERDENSSIVLCYKTKGCQAYWFTEPETNYFEKWKEKIRKKIITLDQARREFESMTGLVALYRWKQECLDCWDRRYPDLGTAGKIHIQFAGC